MAIRVNGASNPKVVWYRGNLVGKVVCNGAVVWEVETPTAPIRFINGTNNVNVNDIEYSGVSHDRLAFSCLLSMNLSWPNRRRWFYGEYGSGLATDTILFEMPFSYGSKLPEGYGLCSQPIYSEAVDLQMQVYGADKPNGSYALLKTFEIPFRFYLDLINSGPDAGKYYLRAGMLISSPAFSEFSDYVLALDMRWELRPLSTGLVSQKQGTLYITPLQT